MRDIRDGPVMMMMMMMMMMRVVSYQVQQNRGKAALHLECC